MIISWNFLFLPVPFCYKINIKLLVFKEFITNSSNHISLLVQRYSRRRSLTFRNLRLHSSRSSDHVLPLQKSNSMSLRLHPPIPFSFNLKNYPEWTNLEKCPNLSKRKSLVKKKSMLWENTSLLSISRRANQEIWQARKHPREVWFITDSYKSKQLYAPEHYEHNVHDLNLQPYHKF